MIGMHELRYEMMRLIRNSSAETWPSNSNPFFEAKAPSNQGFGKVACGLAGWPQCEQNRAPDEVNARPQPVHVARSVFVAARSLLQTSLGGSGDSHTKLCRNTAMKPPLNS
jgi:hypothetical protein